MTWCKFTFAKYWEVIYKTYQQYQRQFSVWVKLNFFANDMFKDLRISLDFVDHYHSSLCIFNHFLIDTIKLNWELYSCIESHKNNIEKIKTFKLNNTYSLQGTSLLELLTKICFNSSAQRRDYFSVLFLYKIVKSIDS